MNRARAERNIVVLLFVFVLALFSLADKDSKKIKQLYVVAEKTIQKLTFTKSPGTTKINPY